MPLEQNRTNERVQLNHTKNYHVKPNRTNLKIRSTPNHWMQNPGNETLDAGPDSVHAQLNRTNLLLNRRLREKHLSTHATNQLIRMMIRWNRSMQIDVPHDRSTDFRDESNHQMIQMTRWNRATHNLQRQTHRIHRNRTNQRMLQPIHKPPTKTNHAAQQTLLHCYP